MSFTEILRKLDILFPQIVKKKTIKEVKVPLYNIIDIWEYFVPLHNIYDILMASFANPCAAKLPSREIKLELELLKLAIPSLISSTRCCSYCCMDCTNSRIAS
jgi:hypothetical protein